MFWACLDMSGRGLLDRVWHGKVLGVALGCGRGLVCLGLPNKGVAQSGSGRGLGMYWTDRGVVWAGSGRDGAGLVRKGVWPGLTGRGPSERGVDGGCGRGLA